MKVGVIAIMGRPNVGKSTLLNALLSKKVSIVSDKPQTTRDDVSGILTEKNYQMVFIDTPGIYNGKGELDRHLKRQAYIPSQDAEAVVYLLDASAASLDADLAILSSLHQSGKLFLVVNKIDLAYAEQVQAKKKLLAESFPKATILEASFKENFGIKELKEQIAAILPEGEPFYEKDALTDKTMSFQAKEEIRQELLHYLHQEIPHQCAVRIDYFKEKPVGIEMHATVICNKLNHKGIIIGKDGAMITRIAQSARKELSRMWRENVSYLRIKVVCDPGWRDDPKKLAKYGYGDDS